MKYFIRNTGANQELEALKNPEIRHRLIRSMIREQMTGSILHMVKTLFDEEVKELSGDRYSRKGTRRCHRGGSEPTSIYLEGHRISLRRPRLRKGGQEVALDNYKALRNFDLMSEELLPLMIRGIATRDYADAVRKIEEGTNISRSTLSRAFVRASQKDLDQINGRNLSTYHLIAIFLDGIVFGGVHLLVALGVTETGEKLVLGLWEGASENARACSDLWSNLKDRGLKIERRFLAIIDGSKALRKAVDEHWGEQALVHRCHQHKTQNVLDYLAKSYQSEARRRLQAAWGMNSYEEAKEELLKTVRWLRSINEGAARSLEEGFEETLTLHRLGLPEDLRKTFRTTNPIESPFAQVRARTNRVKRWQARDQASRWAASAMVIQEKKFRRINGIEHLALLIRALQKPVMKNVDTLVEVG